MLKRFFVGLIVLGLINCSYANVDTKANQESVISNKYLSITMPADTQGTYAVEKTGDSIDIIEITSKKLDEGGYAFGVKIYRTPDNYVDMDDWKKIGELTDKAGKLYDVILFKPREIRYADGETTEKNYNRLYDLADNLEIKGINGCTYFKNRGTKGEDLYAEIIQNYPINKYKKAGYAYYDINNDGIEELFIGKITKGKKVGTIYDVYAVANRKPVHLVSKTSNDKYYICNENYICRELNESKTKNSFTISYLKRNTDKLTNYNEYSYDSEKNKARPWYRTYSATGQKENISKEEYKQGIEGFNYYTKLDYKELSK